MTKNDTMNMEKIMNEAQKIQKKMLEMQDSLKDKDFQGSSGGGLVKITMDGRFDVKKIELDKNILKSEEDSVIEDLIIAAFHNVRLQVEKNATDAVSGLCIPPDFMNMLGGDNGGGSDKK